jgi:hypothetical protein
MGRPMARLCHAMCRSVCGRHGGLFATVALLALSPWSVAFAVSEDDLPPSSAAPVRAPGFGTSPSARSGTYAVVEWNPADLLWERLRLSGEYVVIDGFAFGGVAEYQKQDGDKFKHATTAVGLTATQYLESQTLRGSFLRAEFAGMGTVFTRKDVDVRQEQGVYGMSFGADVGYRFAIASRITGAASYGARRVVPDFFTTQGDSPVEDWKSANKLWTMRVGLTLGVTL